MGKRNQEKQQIPEEEISLDLPEIPSIDPMVLQQKGDQVRAKAAQVRAWVTKTCAFLDRVESLDREAKELIPQAQIDGAEDKLDKLLYKEPSPPLRRAAWIGVFDYHLSREVANTKEAKDLVEKLFNEGYLEYAFDRGSRFSVYSYDYSISEDSCFGEEEYEEIRRMVTSFLKQAEANERATWRKEAERLLSQSTLSLADLREEKPGRIAFPIPAEPICNNGGKPTGWWSGGVLLIGSDGKVLRPLAATGKIEYGVMEARRLNAFVPLYSLGANRPPKVEGSLEKGKKVHLLWYLIQRGIKAAEQKEERKKEKDRMASKATVSMEESFDEEGAEGLCLAEYSGAWKTPDEERISDVFFLIRREGAYLILVEIPEHLKDFLGECVGVPYEERAKFEGVPQPLKAVLQAIFGQVARAARSEMKETVA